MKRHISLTLLLVMLLSPVARPANAEVILGDFYLPEAELTDEALTVDDLELDADALLDVPNGALPEEVAPNRSYKASSIELNYTDITIGIKEKFKILRAVPFPYGSELPTIKWTSSNPKVAKVNSRSGKVTGLKKGTAIIYAQMKGSSSKVRCNVTVLKAPKLSRFSVGPETGSLKVGQTGTFKVTFSRGYGGSVSYRSSDTNIATVNQDGVVTAISPGTCTITVTTYNGVERSVTLQVLNAEDNTEKINKVLKAARDKLGKPYRHSGTGPDKFDCVGFTRWCYKQVGVKLKDSPTKQANDDDFTMIAYNDLKAGDLIYFCTDDNPKVSHAALYLGDNEIIHASYTAKKVITSKLVSSKSDYYKRNFVCARRVFD